MSEDTKGGQLPAKAEVAKKEGWAVAAAKGAASWATVAKLHPEAATIAAIAVASATAHVCASGAGGGLFTPLDAGMGLAVLVGREEIAKPLFARITKNDLNPMTSAQMHSIDDAIKALERHRIDLVQAFIVVIGAGFASAGYRWPSVRPALEWMEMQRTKHCEPQAQREISAKAGALAACAA